ncbi:hypothetical protein [Synechococcus sp. A15-60]|uniref:hypothetical protein n=1 Tax=Synechococcus sp. A15-60 TaxID=1050655 RepID=UPI000C460626|nr:hypothetical protein [Synechococcus sp. A15-60]MAN19700.1 hypothetical protein [Synechococcus sp. EAC657]MEC7897815.1 hypothetical protein [Cyanobacteriota bacterium]QNI48538.1 hypothetical protein SynA1560_01883 [Synechococcus sp. A15-60]
MAKELTHRADELAGLGWSADDVNRYAELWDYRQRWGAMNLEREDRLFLRKAEAALPALVTGKAAAKKSTQDKSYYRWLRFHLDAMKEAEAAMELKDGGQGAWPILLEEELRLLDYFEPVLGLPDTLKAKAFDNFRAQMSAQAAALPADQMQACSYDFQAALTVLKEKENSKWRHLVEDSGDQSYPVLLGTTAESFRNDVRDQLTPLLRQTLPSLADSEKPDPGAA